MHISTITSKGQTTIPIEIRELLNLKPGDKIAFDVTGKRVTLRAKNLPITALKGIVKSPFKRPLTREKERQAIDRYLADKYTPKTAQIAMIGVDTNLLLRYILKDDPVQMKKVERLIEKYTEGGEGLFINRMVLCETVWVLSRSYRLPKPAILALIDALLDIQGLVIDAEETVKEALEIYRQHNLDFIDIFIAVDNHHAGVAYTATFDKKAAAPAQFRLLK